MEMALPPTGDLGESGSEVGGQWQCFAGGPEHLRLWVLPSSSVGSQVRCCHCHLHK